MNEAPWDVYSSRVAGSRGVTYFLDIKEGAEGRRLVVTQSYPSGQRNRVTIPAGDTGAFVSELLKAVSQFAGPCEPPQQHSPHRSASERAYQPWTDEEDAKLLRERSEGHGIAHVARSLRREPSAISSRLRKLAGLTASSSSPEIPERESAATPNPEEPTHKVGGGPSLAAECDEPWGDPASGRQGRKGGVEEQVYRE